MLQFEHQRRVLKIPLTPLIDVVFILLLFFMLSSSFLDTRMIGFAIPESSTIVSSSTDENWLRMSENQSVAINGKTFLQQHPAFTSYLAKLAREQAKVTVSAHSSNSIQMLVELLDRLRNAGVTRIDVTRSWE